jgi:hypothetical protein
MTSSENCLEAIIAGTMQRLFGSVLILAVALASSAQKPKEARPPRVPDSASAILIARRVAIREYGKKTIEYEEPLEAVLDNGVWFVGGTSCCGKHPCEPTCLGGGVSVKIRQRDGKILAVIYTK